MMGGRKPNEHWRKRTREKRNVFVLGHVHDAISFREEKVTRGAAMDRTTVRSGCEKCRMSLGKAMQCTTEPAESIAHSQNALK